MARPGIPCISAGERRTISGSTSPFTSPLGDDGIFVYTRRNPVTNDTGLSYRYEYSFELKAGQWMDGSSFAESGDSGAEVKTVEVTIPVALRSNPAIFVRVIAF